MPNDINELDVNDIGLKGIFGDRFHDETQGFVAERKERKSVNATNTAKAEQKATDKPVTAQWEPVKEANWMDSLKSSVKWAGLFGGLSFLVFYWQQAGLMDASIAVPTMCVCTALAGWGVGVSCARGKR